MQQVVAQPMLAQDTQCVQSLCTGLYDAVYVVNVTPRIFIVCTRWSNGILSGIGNFLFGLWSVKIISWLFVKLSFRLLASAHLLTLCNSAERESTLTAGIMRYVSSAYLQLVTACKSDASTTYHAGPIADPWMCSAVSFRKILHLLTKIVGK